MSVQNIKDTFLILRCTIPFCPQNSLNSPGHGLYKVSSIPQGCWPMLTSVLPTVVASSLDILWVVDYSLYTRETVAGEKPSSVAVLDTHRCAWHLLPYLPCSTAHKSFVLPIPQLNGTHTQSMSIVSRLTNPPLTCLPPFIYTD